MWKKEKLGKETETKGLPFFSGDKLLQKGGRSEIKSFARVTFEPHLAAKGCGFKCQIFKLVHSMVISMGIHTSIHFP